jgi:acyl transferase domain-containing protein
VIVSPTPRPDADISGAIAIVGMACRFPGGSSLDAFWDSLRSGHDAIGALPVGRWRHEPWLQQAERLCRRGGFLDDVAGFEPELFGFSDLEALLMDPQQRLFLEIALETFEHAGRAGPSLAGSRTGVFVGARASGYHSYFYDQVEEILGAREDIATNRGGVVGSLTNYIAAHVAHRFDLRGPSLAIDTACSSSLLSVHLACESLRRGECAMALAGGVELKVTPNAHRYLSQMRALALDGVSRVFDILASGFVPGEGAGAVLLKPLARALADHDTIYAVIRGSAANNDGRTLGLTTPSLEAQVAVLEDAYLAAGVDPSSVGYVEAHGTGTPLGDPIEIKHSPRSSGATLNARGPAPSGRSSPASGTSTRRPASPASSRWRWRCITASFRRPSTATRPTRASAWRRRRST